MVVAKSFDISVDVRVDDLVLNEYDDQKFDNHNANPDHANQSRDLDEGVSFVAISKYIEAKANKVFKIVFSIGKDYPFKDWSTRVEVRVDGHFADSRIVNKSKYRKLTRYIDEITGSRQVKSDWATSTYAFRFDELNIVDEADVEGDEQFMGTIHVRFWRVESSKGGPWRRHSERPSSAGDRKIPEKSLKKGGAVSHGTGFSPNSNDGRTWGVKVKYFDGKEYPFLDVCFKFRGRNALKQLRIIPQSRAPTPFEMTDPLKMSDEEKTKAILLLQEKQRVFEKKEHSRPSDSIENDRHNEEERASVQIVTHSTDANVQDNNLASPDPQNAATESNALLYHQSDSTEQTLNNDDDDDDDGEVVFLGTRSMQEERYRKRGPGDTIVYISDSEDEDSENELFHPTATQQT